VRAKGRGPQALRSESLGLRILTTLPHWGHPNAQECCSINFLPVSCHSTPLLISHSFRVVVVEVVYCAGNNASLLPMNTAATAAVASPPPQSSTRNFAVVVVDKVVASFRPLCPPQLSQSRAEHNSILTLKTLTMGSTQIQ